MTKRHCLSMAKNPVDSLAREKKVFSVKVTNYLSPRICTSDPMMRSYRKAIKRIEHKSCIQRSA